MQYLPDSQNTDTVISTIEQRIVQERIRQARNAFNLALASTFIATTLSIISLAAFLSNKPTIGTLTTAGGLISIHSTRLAKDANDRLDKLIVDAG